MGLYNWNGESVDTAVIQAVATEAECDPVDLDSLYDAVDPDAIAALFDDASEHHMRRGRLTFTYSGYELVVVSDGTIEVNNATDTAETSPIRN